MELNDDITVWWEELDPIAAKVLRGTLWSGERALARYFWACLAERNLTAAYDEQERQVVFARFVAIVRLIDEVDGCRRLFRESGEQEGVLFAFEPADDATRAWRALDDLDWDDFRLGQLVGPDALGDRDDAIHLLATNESAKVLAVLSRAAGSKDALLACLVEKDEGHDYLDLVDDVAAGRHRRGPLREPWVFRLRASLFGEVVVAADELAPALGGTAPEAAGSVVSLSGQLRLFPYEYERDAEVRWSDVVEQARTMLGYWASDAGLHFGRLAWRALRRQGLTCYGDALSRHQVILRFLALGVLYQRFAMVAWQHGDDDADVDFDSWCEGLDVAPLRIGQLVGTDAELDDDPADALREALDLLTRAELPTLLDSLVRGFGSWAALFGVLIHSEEMGHYEWALIEPPAWAGVNWPHLDDHTKLTAFEWLRGCARAV